MAPDLALTCMVVSPLDDSSESRRRPAGVSAKRPTGSVSDTTRRARGKWARQESRVGSRRAGREQGVMVMWRPEEERRRSREERKSRGWAAVDDTKPSACRTDTWRASMSPWIS